MSRFKHLSRKKSIWGGGNVVKYFIDDQFYVRETRDGLTLIRKSDGRNLGPLFYVRYYQAKGITKANDYNDRRFNGDLDRVGLIKP